MMSLFFEQNFIQYIKLVFIIEQFLQKMNKSRIRSPQQGLKRSQIIASPTGSKSRAYLPSRYAQERKAEKTGFQDILNSIETKMSTENIKPKGQASPKIKQNPLKTDLSAFERKPKTSQFKNRPLKRQKNDEMNFNEIFLNPRQEALEELKMKSCLEDNIKTISKQYQKLLNFEKGQQAKDLMEEKATDNGKIQESYKQAIQMLEAGDAFGIKIQSNETDFYDEQISMDPPDIPINASQQPVSSGVNHSPSIPSNYKNFKNFNLKELLIRVRSGMNSEDVEKQAHLSYFLGQIYSQKKMYYEALKFNRRYLGFAKAMEDMIGLSVGANRVAISYYNCGQVQKSVLFHNENLKLSNNDNCFVGFYNIGICYRKLKKFEQALEYFQSALSWAQEKGEEESECIAHGQIGVTYQAMELYQQAIQKFQKSNQICDKIKKKQLKLNNLRYILRICSMLNLKPPQNLLQIVEQGFICSREASKLRMLDIFRCNIGIVKGIQQMTQQIIANGQDNEIQEI